MTILPRKTALYTGLFCFLLLIILWGTSPNRELITGLLQESTSDLISLIGLIGTFYFLGNKLLFVISNSKEEPLSQTILSITLGMAVWGFMIFGLGLCQLLYFSIIITLVIMGGILGFYILFRDLYPYLNPQSINDENLTTVLGVIILLTLSVLFLISGILPPVGYDALEYHFGAPTWYQQNHLIGWLSGNIYAHMPSLMEMLLTGGMILNGIVTGKMILWLVTIMTGFVLFIAGRRLSTAYAGIIAGSIFLALPMALKLNLQGNIDIVMALFGTIALYFVMEWLQTKSTIPILYCGLFTGISVACKYISIPVIAFPLFLIILYRIVKDKRYTSLKDLGIWIGIASIPVIPWLYKNYIFTGNPVYPLLYNWFGYYDWNIFLAQKYHTAHAFNLNPNHLLDLHTGLFIPFELTGNTAPYTLLPILLIPLIALKGLTSRTQKTLICFAFIGYAGWLFTNQVDRFLLPVISILCLSSGIYISEAIHSLEKDKKILITGLIVVFITLNLINQQLLTNNLLQGIKIYPGSNESSLKESYLNTYVSVHPAYQWINKNINPHDRLLFIAEARRTYLERNAELSTVFNKDLFLEMGRYGKTEAGMLALFKELHIRYIFYNAQELKRLEAFYGPYHDPRENRATTQLLTRFLETQTEEVFDINGMKLLLIRDTL